MINPGTALATATTAVEDFTTSSSYPNEEGGAYHVIELHEDSTVLDLQRAVFAKLQGAVEAVQNVPLMADWQGMSCHCIELQYYLHLLCPKACFNFPNSSHFFWNSHHHCDFFPGLSFHLNHLYFPPHHIFCRDIYP
jgi:hypothetical protein